MPLDLTRYIEIYIISPRGPQDLAEHKVLVEAYKNLSGLRVTDQQVRIADPNFTTSWNFGYADEVRPYGDILGSAAGIEMLR